MKILQLIQKSQLRGAEIFACQLSEKLIDKGYESIVVSLFKGDVSMPLKGGVKCLNANQSSRFIDFRAWKHLAKIIKQEQPDIIQANAGDTLKYAVLSKIFYRWKQPIVFRNASTISLYIKSAIKKRWNNLLYKKADYIVSVSDSSKDDFIALFPEVKNRITVIPIGVDRITLEQKQNKNTPVLIHVGGFSFEKNHSDLLEIFKKVNEEISQAELWLVGDGPLREQIEEKAIALKIKQHIKFWGAVPNAFSLIQEADVLLLPSIIEGLPGVILEAFYARIPVVAYNVGGVKEIVTEKTGWLIEKNNIPAFTNAVIDILREAPAITAKIENARTLVEAGYTNDIIADKFIGLYKKVSKKYE